MSILSNISLNMWVAFAAFVGVFFGLIAINMVNRTVGFVYAVKLFQMKKKHNKNKVLLKIWLANGKPVYKIKEVANIIEYEYKENGKTKTGMVKYDYYSMYKDFNDIPILECDPNDILPRNPFINTSMTISGSMLKKNLQDSAKEDTKGDDLKKFLKAAAPIIAIVFIGVILYNSSQADALAQCTAKTIELAQQLGTRATIVAN